MRGRLVLPLLLLCGAAAAQELTFGKEPYQVRALEFQVAVPEGWQAEQDHRNVVVRDRNRTGFIVSREPFLHDPKTFAEAWGAELGSAGRKTEVTQAKVGRLQAWRARWTSDAAGGRNIEIWRIYVPRYEMLYNFSFTAASGTDLAPLVTPVCKSFKVTAPAPTLAFADRSISVGTRFTLTLPRGYEQVQRGPGIGEVALYYGGLHFKHLKGYKEPHRAGRIAYRTFTADRPIGMPGGRVIQATNVKDMAQGWWDSVEAKLLDRVVGKPKRRAVRVSGLKGAGVTAEGLSKQGLPQRVYVYVGRIKRHVLILTLAVDEREVRQHKDLFKQICSRIKVAR
ncbi:MAG: hypothetical protein ACYTEZ_08555 [Planctomycetota bacterium]|jgi:hypothetical protein